MQDLNGDFTLKNFLFGNVKLTKNPDADKYSYFGCSLGFDSCFLSSYPEFDWDKNFVIFGVENSSSVLADNNKKDILVFGEGPRQGLDDATITAEANYSINFSRPNRKFSLRLHYNRNNFFYLIMI